jgi:hypothetical protein
MANRIIYRGSNPNGRSVVVRRDTEWNQYIVQFFDGETYLFKADAYATDRVEAFDTAQHWLKG